MQVKKEAMLITDTLDFLRDRRCNSEEYTPSSFLTIATKMEQVRAEGRQVLIELSEISNAYSVKITIDKVYPRWCLGYQRIFKENAQDILVPYTIHYSDILTASQTKTPKVIIEGDKVFG